MITMICSTIVLMGLAAIALMAVGAVAFGLKCSELIDRMTTKK